MIGIYIYIYILYYIADALAETNDVVLVQIQDIGLVKKTRYAPVQEPALS